MTAPLVLRAIPVEDRAWLVAALDDALAGGAPILPLAPGLDPADSGVESIRSLPLPDDTAVVVRTSGSSGVPKAVALSRAALVASAEATHEALGGPGQWLVALPAQLISGLQMLVRSSVSGIEPVFAPEGAGARELLAAADQLEHERRYVSLVPVQLARLLDLAETDADAAEALTRFDAVLVGGQAVSLELRRRAHALGVSLRRSYGMTETSGGCVYDGVEIGDTLVRIRGGEVQLAGPTLALGYVGDAAQTEDRFVVEAGRDGTPIRWYRTGDAGELLGGMLTVTGRLDRVVISGGVNVSLDEIERVAREFPGWGSAIALATEHPEWGSRPSLVVEIEPDAAPFDEVREAIRARLGAAAAPEWATETEKLPRLAGGKPDLAAIERWISSLRSSFARARGAAADAPVAAAPQTDEGTTE
ncbi:AMP-binding protein [Leucobacter albus]|uniref:AMP-binding protein n=1 Tax=Leucobacter albus TaxID=272210 RepID=A0ABW3TLP1_9MICO